MAFSIEVENIKCGGCANSIQKKLTQLAGVEEVKVEIDAGIVTVEADECQKDDIVQTLADLGYPEVGSVSGLQSAGAKAKSFVSCAVGRMTDED